MDSVPSAPWFANLSVVWTLSQCTQFKHVPDRSNRRWTFWLSSSHTMTITLPTIDVPYLITNSPPQLTTHLALNVCEALHHPSLCEARDVKDEDKLMHLAFSLFSSKQLPAVMCLELRKQKLLSNAMDGSYLLCQEHMLRTQWKGGHAGKLLRQASSRSGSWWGLDYIHVV